MLCCANTSKDISPSTMNKMKLLPENGNAEDSEDPVDATNTMDKEMTPQPKVVPPPSVKMAGYLDKRGKRFLTWKQYWFVLDGHLLMYFRNQFEYLNSLSPCRGTINLGLVSGVRPAGSRSSPQLELLSRSQTVLLRAKERNTQERWLQAILDAMQMHPATGTSTFRYTNASLPKTTSTRNEEETEEDEIATQNVLQRIKHIGGQSQASLVAELRTRGTGSLRHVSSPHNTPRSKTSPQRVAEITAQLPTNKAVLRLLERRQEEEDEHVTTIVVDPGRNQGPEEPEVSDVPAKQDVPLPSEVVENTALSQNGKAESADDLEILNDGYVATQQVKPEMTEEDDELYEKVPAIETPTPDTEDEEDVDYDTMGPVEEPSYEPSVPPRRSLDQKPLENTKPKEPENIETKEKEALAPTPTIVKRKRSFLARMLGKNKNKKVVTQETVQKIPQINVEYAEEEEKNEREEEETDDYETVDYEELIKNRMENEKKMLENSTEELADNNAMTNGSVLNNSEDKIRIELKAESKVVNTVTCNTEPMQEITSNIVPIVENEKTHTVTITVHNSEEQDRPKLPPRRPSSGESISSTRPVSPCHDVPTNNAPVIAKTKRRSSEYIYTAMPVSLVTDLEHEDCDLHKTIINIPSEDTVISATTITEPASQEEDECKDCSSSDLELIKNLQVPHCSHKHRSADELDILLQELTNITNSPLHSASVDTLVPLRKHRTGEDPDYDIPRPHQMYLTLRKPHEKIDDETLEATRFFNEPELHYARPLSEYLQELERMSNQQQRRSTRASNAFQKWIAESQNSVICLPSVAEDILDVVDGKTIQFVEQTSESIKVSSTEVPEPLKDKETEEPLVNPVCEEICVNAAKLEEVCGEKQEDLSESTLTNQQEQPAISKISHKVENSEVVECTISREENDENNNGSSEHTAADEDLINEEAIPEPQETNSVPEPVTIISEHDELIEPLEQNNNEVTQETSEVQSTQKEEQTSEVTQAVAEAQNNQAETPQNNDPVLTQIEVITDYSQVIEEATDKPDFDTNFNLAFEYLPLSLEPLTSPVQNDIKPTNEDPLPTNEINETQPTNNKDIEGPDTTDQVKTEELKIESKNHESETETKNQDDIADQQIETIIHDNIVDQEAGTKNQDNIADQQIETMIHDNIVDQEAGTKNQDNIEDTEIETIIPVNNEESEDKEIETIIQVNIEECESKDAEEETVSEDLDQVVLRTSPRIDNTVRLSYALTEAEIVVEETVDTIKTPYTSSMFSYPTTDQGIPQDPTESTTK